MFNLILILSFLWPALLFGQNSSLKEKELEAHYTQAIGEYLLAVQKEKQTRFDTLFINKHPEFPDLQLPFTIQNTAVVIIDPEAVNKKMSYKKAIALVNLICWVNQKDSEFIFVLFSHGYRHEYDAHLYFNYETKSKSYRLQKLSFEDPQPTGK